MVLASENLQVFVILLVVVFDLTGGFSFHGFSTSSLTLPWAIAIFLHLFYTFSPAHRRVIRDTFILTFLGFSFLPWVLRFWVKVFYPWMFFTLYSFVLWLRRGQEHPIQNLPVPVLAKLSLLADAWPSTIDAWIIRPLIYQLHQWATKYRVKIELLNMICLLKVICKDY